MMVKVMREKIEACMTCPICNKLFREATSISECLHTFCRKCIYEKIREEDLDCCPVCDANLGCAPWDKLRADHSIQDLRQNIFPSKITTSKAVEPVLSSPSPMRRKEISLSSLEINTPTNPAQTTSTLRTMKSAARKVIASRELDFSIEEANTTLEDHSDFSSSPSPETLNKIAQNKLNAAKNLTIGKGKDNVQISEAETDMWKHVEASSKSKICSISTIVKLETLRVHDGQDCVGKDNVKENDDSLKVNDYENGWTPPPVRANFSRANFVKPTKEKRVRQKKSARMEMINRQAHQAAVDATSECEQGVNSIWFSLVASTQQKEVAPLPQLPSRYLRIKDGNIPVSYIKKYLVKKLDLDSEAEMEITLRGQTLPSAWQLHELVDLWLHTAPTSQRIQTTVGSSAKDVVLVLLYSRKVQLPCMNGPVFKNIARFWDQVTIEKERSQATKLSIFRSSEVVGIQAPMQLGSLRVGNGKD